MQEINPAETTRRYAFEMWMNAPMPMVTLIKSLDVTDALRLSRRRGLKFNMLMCYCIGRAASQVKEFFTLPVGDSLIRYDALAVNTIVADSSGEVSSCDIPFSPELETFGRDYLRLTREVAHTCRSHDITDRMVIGTSALTSTVINGAIGMYSGIFNNPFMIWGRYRRGLLRTTLTVSFQFHHTQMDGAHAARFLELLQTELRRI
jgi:chloramphenicol O-acetyltransferase type A